MNATLVTLGTTTMPYARSSRRSGMAESREARISSSTWVAISSRPSSRACAWAWVAVNASASAVSKAESATRLRMLESP